VPERRERHGLVYFFSKGQSLDSSGLAASSGEIVATSL
jgi:hypothetical protein